MAGFVAGDVFNQDDGGVYIKFLTECNVEGLVTRAFDRSMQDTFQTEFVAFQGSDGFAEEIFGVLVACVNAGDIDLFPFDRDVVGFEDCFHGLCDLCTNTVTCVDL